MGTANQEWDGLDRRHPNGWDRYEIKVLSDIKDMQEEVSEVKKDMGKMQVAFAEMKVEIKQIVGASATKTSGWVSLGVSIVSGIVIFLLTGVKPN